MGNIVKKRIIGWIGEHQVQSYVRPRKDGYVGSIQKLVNNYILIPIIEGKQEISETRTTNRVRTSTFLLSTQQEYLVYGINKNKEIYLGIETNGVSKNWDVILEQKRKDLK